MLKITDHKELYPAEWSVAVTELSQYLIDPVKLGLAPGSYTLRVETDSGEIPFVELTGELTKVMLSAAGTVSINVANVGDVLPDALTEFNGRQMSTTN